MISMQSAATSDLPDSRKLGQFVRYPPTTYRAAEPDKAGDYRAKDNEDDPLAGRLMLLGHGHEHPEESD
jgi:hypothetical protein